MSDNNETIENEAVQSQYTKAVELLESDSLQDVLQARELFKELGNYQNAGSYVNQCSEKIASIRANTLLNKYSDEKQVVEKKPVSAAQEIHEPEPQAAPQPVSAPAAAAPKKQGKTGLIIAAIVVIAAVFAGGLALGGVFNKDKTDEPGNAGSITDTADSGVEQEESSAHETPEFAKTDILSFEQLELVTDPDMDNSKRATYKVTNTGDDIIWSISAEFQFLDKDGNEIYHDGRSFRGKLEPGKWCYLDSYSYDVDPDEIDSINVKSYDYMIDQIEYAVDLQTKTAEVEKYDDWYSNVDFDEANILDITLGEGEGDSEGNVSADITVKNGGSQNIKDISIDIPYYNKNKDVLYVDGRSSDSLLKPGKSVRVESYVSPDYYYGSEKVDSFGVTEYEYTLQEKDDKGYNYYTVNLVTNTAYGEYYDD